MDLAVEHNEQVAKLIGALGSNNAGRRAIFKALAHDRFDRKIDVPASVQGALNAIRLIHTMAPIIFMLIRELGLDQVLISNVAWENIEFEGALDSS